MLATALLALTLCAFAATASAQASNQRSATASGGARVELSGGVGWLGAVSLGKRDATLRGNSQPPASSLLFTTTTRLAPAPSVHVQVGLRLTRRYSVEGRLAHARPELATSVSGDVEGAAALTATERLREFLVEGGIALRLKDDALGGTIPFVAAGMGYHRQLHEGQTLIEQGMLGYAGAGLRRSFLSRASGHLRSMGWRVDGRLYVLGSDLSGKRRLHTRPAVTASVFASF